ITFFSRDPSSQLVVDSQNALASIPDSEKPAEYKVANIAFEGTSYEYPQRRLTTTDLKSQYKISIWSAQEGPSKNRRGTVFTKNNKFFRKTLCLNSLSIRRSIHAIRWPHD
ncbi:hypothetical protein N9Z84_01795, partial [Pirellulales bacterium]|nr:hypothetical protein [Pirellulales bacterium]